MPSSQSSHRWAKFKEKYLAGEIAFEEIDDYSQEWGFSDEPVTLREYLGLNVEEEDAWVSIGDEALRELLDFSAMREFFLPPRS